jgi:anthranilate synthase component 2
VTSRNEYLFDTLPDEFLAGRYHSWVVNEEDLPEELEITAREAEGQIMGVRHREFDVRGVQFHPESVLTEHGKQMIRNWLKN